MDKLTLSGVVREPSSAAQSALNIGLYTKQGASELGHTFVKKEEKSMATTVSLPLVQQWRPTALMADSLTSATPGAGDCEADFKGIVGRSAALRHVLEQVEMVAPSDSTVLLLGETGTGKELIAQAIHERSVRSKRSLVKLNCAAIPSGLLE